MEFLIDYNYFTLYTQSIERVLEQPVENVYILELLYNLIRLVLKKDNVKFAADWASIVQLSIGMFTTNRRHRGEHD